jgi:hypothetical protein
LNAGWINRFQVECWLDYLSPDWFPAGISGSWLNAAWFTWFLINCRLNYLAPKPVPLIKYVSYRLRDINDFDFDFLIGLPGA